jgi:WXG100 family type VII secretion target
MAEEIRADYDKLEEVAGRFNNQSQEMQQMGRQVRASYGKLRDGGWIGDAATKFFGEMEELVFPASDRLTEALEEAGQTTQRIAQTVKQAEQEASSLFSH